MSGLGLPVVSGKAVVAALIRGGWERASSSGGCHVKLTKAGRPDHVTVPIHGNRDLPPGTLKGILAQAGIDGEELRRLL